jgi:hypothetical protein
MLENGDKAALPCHRAAARAIHLASHHLLFDIRLYPRHSTFAPWIS